MNAPSSYPELLEIQKEGKAILKLLIAFSLDNENLGQLSQDEIALMEAHRKEQMAALTREFQDRVRAGNKPM